MVMSFCRSIQYRDWSRQHLVPESYFTNFHSSTLLSSDFLWTTVRFTNEPYCEAISVAGTDDGQIMVVNSDTVKTTILDDRFLFGCVYDVNFIPKNSNVLVSISGVKSVALWDITYGLKVQGFASRFGSIRTLAICDESCDVFATGSRDGNIFLWDRRLGESAFGSHVLNIIDTRSSQACYAKSSGRGVISLVFTNEYTLASATVCSSDGILLWDRRYVGRNKTPLAILNGPKGKHRSDPGIVSLCVDKRRQVLFVASANSFVYEYLLSSHKKDPIGVLSGGKVHHNEICSSRLAVSSTSNYLIYGNHDEEAHIWDLQKKCFRNYEAMPYLKRPSYVAAGHHEEVNMGAFSCQDKYIVTLSGNKLMYWSYTDSGNTEEDKNIDSQIGIESFIEFYDDGAECSSMQTHSTSVSVSSERESSKHRNGSWQITPSTPVKFESNSTPLSAIKNFDNATTKAITSRKRKGDWREIEKIRSNMLRTPLKYLPNYAEEMKLLEAIINGKSKAQKESSFKRSRLSNQDKSENKSLDTSEDCTKVLYKGMDFMLLLSMGFCHPMTFNFYKNHFACEFNKKQSKVRTLIDYFTVK